MKNIFLILVMVFMAGMSYAVQPPRKPFIQITIDGKSYKNGEMLTITPGQKMLIAVEMQGGRRDYCKFPETYADITATAQILSRSKDGLVYQINGTKAEWKLLAEDAKFTSDEFVKVTPVENKPSAELEVTSDQFSQSYVKIDMKTTWQFTQGEQTSKEDNLAESTIYFKAAGSTDDWFSSEHIQASGLKNEQVQDKLNAVKAGCDSVETNIYKLKFSAVQQSIRDLQATVNTLKSTIDEVTSSNPSYRVKVTFIGLPSDRPFKDIDELSIIKNKWDSLSIVVSTLKEELVKLPAKPKKENIDELIRIITEYKAWQDKLAQNTIAVLSRYMPEINIETVKMPAKFKLIAEQKAIPDYSTALTEFRAFVESRNLQAPDELQKINSVRTRIQAVRLFDGMLRSYFSSINWAEWKSTRGF